MNDSHPLSLYLGIGLSLGASLGVAIGAAGDNLELWLPLGASLGLCLGLGIGVATSEQIKKQNTEANKRFSRSTAIADSRISDSIKLKSK